ncbi:MAG: hypothetical protein WC782_01630 [Methylococcaceae bacterium]|jgi:hypothetical protein
MRKLVSFISVLTATLLLSNVAYAEGKHGHGHAYGHHKNHGEHEQEYYAPSQPNHYYPEQHRSAPSDQRSTEGLLGGAVGSALGYQIGNGDPVASGLGAAAGAYLGNKVGSGR